LTRSDNYLEFTITDKLAGASPASFFMSAINPILLYIAPDVPLKPIIYSATQGSFLYLYLIWLSSILSGYRYMIKWAPYVFVRFTGYLVLGILAAIYLPSNTVATEIILAGFYIMAGVYLLLSLVVSHFWKSKRLGSISGIVGFAVLFLAGYTITYQRTQSNNPDHLLHQPDSVRYYTGVIVSEVSSTNKSHKAQLSLRSVYVQNQWRAASGKVLLYLHKEYSQTSIWR
jgi:hypothetical protein